MVSLVTAHVLVVRKIITEHCAHHVCVVIPQEPVLTELPEMARARIAQKDIMVQIVLPNVLIVLSEIVPTEFPGMESVFVHLHNAMIVQLMLVNRELQTAKEVVELSYQQQHQHHQQHHQQVLPALVQLPLQLLPPEIPMQQLFRECHTIMGL